MHAIHPQKTGQWERCDAQILLVVVASRQRQTLLMVKQEGLAKRGCIVAAGIAGIPYYDKHPKQDASVKTQ